MPLHATLKVPQNEMSFEVLKKKLGEILWVLNGKKTAPRPEGEEEWRAQEERG